MLVGFWELRRLNVFHGTLEQTRIKVFIVAGAQNISRPHHVALQFCSGLRHIAPVRTFAERWLWLSSNDKQKRNFNWVVEKEPRVSLGEVERQTEIFELIIQYYLTQELPDFHIRCKLVQNLEIRANKLGFNSASIVFQDLNMIQIIEKSRFC